MRVPFVSALLLPAALVASMTTSAIPPPLPSSSKGLGPKDGGTWPQNGALGLTQTYGSSNRKDARGAVVETVIGDIDARIDGVAARVVRVPSRAPGASSSEWEVMLDPLPQPGQQVFLGFEREWDPISQAHARRTVRFTATAPDTTAPPPPQGLTLDLVHQKFSGCAGDRLVWHTSLSHIDDHNRVRVEFHLGGGAEPYTSQVLSAGSQHAQAGASEATVGWWRDAENAMCVRARTLDASGNASAPIEVCRVGHVKVVEVGDAASQADPPVFESAERVSY
jgi:hypothetical protein